MIDPADLHRLGIALLAQHERSETELRRGISTLYYGVFHLLTSAGSSVFRAGGPLLIDQAARAFSHTTMRQVCDTYARSRRQPFPSPLDRLIPDPPDERLIQVAEAFILLQEARHTADYDIPATIDSNDALDLMTQAEFVHWTLHEMALEPQTTVFLTALLLADRWKRRG